MSNLQKFEATEIMSIGKAFFESGMFTDIKSAAQAFVKIQAGAEMGIKPFSAMSGIHIIQGKPTVGAGLMASTLKASGKYDYRVIEMTDKSCSVDFFQGSDKIGNSTFTIDDAKKAQTKNMDKFPKNMLFARAMSNGVKWFCPDVFAGPVYVPEEINQVTEDVQHEVVEDPEVTAAYLATWEEAINQNGESMAALIDYYNANKTTIEGDPAIKQLFSNRKTRLYEIAVKQQRATPVEA